MKRYTLHDDEAIKKLITDIVEREVRKTFKIPDFTEESGKFCVYEYKDYFGEVYKELPKVLIYDGVNIGTVDREGNFTPDGRYAKGCHKCGYRGYRTVIRKTLTGEVLTYEVACECKEKAIK